MAVVNYASQYLQALSQEFPRMLKFGKLYETPQNNRYRFINSKTIEIPVVTLSGRRDSNRDEIVTPRRRWDNEWIPKTLANERYWDNLWHEKDIDQTNYAASIANITKEYNEQYKFPEMDAYCVSKLFSEWTAASKTASTTALTVDNVLNEFDKMYQDMVESRVPVADLTLYITPAVDTLLKNAKQISRSLAIGSSKAIAERAIQSLDSIEIEVVPSDMMKTVYDFTEGWKPAVSAKQINMFMVDPWAVITPVSYDAAALDEPSAKTNLMWYYYEESHEDVFILPNKANALAFNIEA